MPEVPPRPRQLALDLPVDSRHGVEDFLVGPSNEAAYGLVEAWPQWPEAWLRLVGPEGAGKTHLAAIWAKTAHAWTVPVAQVRQANVPHLVSGGALVVEDCDVGPRDEPALFHLMNAIKAKGGFLLLTARSAPDLWGLQVPDLLSRLRLAPAGHDRRARRRAAARAPRQALHRPAARGRHRHHRGPGAADGALLRRRAPDRRRARQALARTRPAGDAAAGDGSARRLVPGGVRELPPRAHAGARAGMSRRVCDPRACCLVPEPRRHPGQAAKPRRSGIHRRALSPPMDPGSPLRYVQDDDAFPSVNSSL